MRIGLGSVACLFLAASLAGVGAHAQAPKADFNKSVIDAVNYLNAHYTLGGYDSRYSFTHNLSYIDGEIPKTSPGSKIPAASMCVATMKEVIVTALWLYTDKGNNTARINEILDQKADLSFWHRGSVVSITPYIYMYSEVSSAGTADALSKFGMGEKVPFAKLKQGDFVNLNRNNSRHTGHAVVFWGYLLRNGSLTSTYSDTVVGFRYFSDQGQGTPDGGLGFRNGYFDGYCGPTTAGLVSDCKIVRSSNPRLLNTGRMWSPGSWTVTTSVAELRMSVAKDISDQSPGIEKGLIDLELDREITPNIPDRYVSEP